MADSYSKEDIQQILALAMKQEWEQADFSPEQLGEMGAELGISPQKLERAEQQWFEQKHEQKARRAFVSYRLGKFQKHLFSYLVVNAFLVIIDLITDGSLDWSYWPILGWGIGLAFEARKTYQLSGSEYEQQFRQWWRAHSKRTKNR